MTESIGRSPETIFAIPEGYRYIELYENGKRIAFRDETEQEFAKPPTVEGIVLRYFHPTTDGLMHSAAVIADGITFDENLQYSEDWEFMLVLSRLYPSKFLYVPKILYVYKMRFGGDGVVSGANYSDMADSYKYIYEKHQNDPRMNMQDWYPRKYNEFLQMSEDYKKGMIPSFDRFYFKDHWDDKYKKLG